MLAFYFPRVKGTAAFWGVLAGEVVIFAFRFGTEVAFLWFNVIGSVVVVVTALILFFRSGGFAGTQCRLIGSGNGASLERANAWSSKFPTTEFQWMCRFREFTIIWLIHCRSN